MSPEKPFFFFGYFLESHLQHIEVPRLGFKSELQLPASTTATATPDPSCVRNLHHTSWQSWTLNLLSKTRDQIHILTETWQVLNLMRHNGNSPYKSQGMSLRPLLQRVPWASVEIRFPLEFTAAPASSSPSSAWRSPNGSGAHAWGLSPFSWFFTVAVSSGLMWDLCPQAGDWPQAA